MSLALVILCSVTVFAEQVVLSSGIGDGPLIRAYGEILRVAYGRIGIDLVIEHMPWERSLRSSETGKFDGEVFRAPVVEKVSPDLVRVDVPLGFIEFLAYSNRQDVTVARWDDLARYRVGYLRGIKVIEAHLNPQNNNIGAKDAKQLIGVLMYGRVDVVVANKLFMQNAMTIYGDQSIRPLEPSLEVTPSYHYLHESKRHLVGPLEKVLRGMREDGTIDRITNRAVKESMEE